MRKKWILAPLAIIALVLFVALGGEVVMRLWNWLLPAIFGWRQVNFWQALGLLALCRILFGRWGGHRSHFRDYRWRWQLGRRWRHMTPEERDKFRQEFVSRCGPFRTPDATPAP
jgi:hypothetical protein